MPTQLYINGEWVEASGGATVGVFDPATGAELTRIADATVDDGAKALDAAVAAQAEWAATSPRYRGELLRKAFERVQELKDDFALLMTLEMGKPLAEAMGEVNYGSEFLRWFSEEAVRITGRYGINPENTGRAIVSYLPVGPCFLITPWNFPLAMATRKIAPAIAAGCTMVVKPATLTPLTTLYFVKILEEVGVPKGVVNVITTTKSSQVSAPIIADKRLRKLSFTGSTAVGISLMKQAADNVLRTSMELGGNAPFVVFEDADLDKAVEGALMAKFRNIGQACTAANRFIVHESVADEFSRSVTERVAAMKIGRGTDPGVNIGPLIDDKAVAKAQELVRDAESRGAKVTTGGKVLEGAGYFFEPTVVANVQPGSEILTEEIFGPVLSCLRVANFTEALNLVNSCEFGNGVACFTSDGNIAREFARRVQVGMVGINVPIPVPMAWHGFGGWKKSIFGDMHAYGKEGVRFYTKQKSVMQRWPESIAKGAEFVMPTSK